MKPPKEKAEQEPRWKPVAGACKLALILCSALVLRASPVKAQCDDCSSYSSAQSAGVVTNAALSEASGLAASIRNPGVLWTHNDGNRQRVYAISTNGVLLASFSIPSEIVDMEDVAVAQGPGGTPVVYFGDIGASSFPNQIRRELHIVRVPEPDVQLAWGSDPKSGQFQNVTDFRLRYPDGSFDAEALLADTKSSFLYVATKQEGFTRLYRADVSGITNGGVMDLAFVRTVFFDSPSGGAVSADGTRVILRRENAAMEWTRCEGEAMSAAFSRPGKSVPLPSLIAEPNGEAVAYLPDRSGYFTIGEGAAPGLFFVASTCPRPPAFTLELATRRVFEGASVELSGEASGFPAPVFSWTFNGKILEGAASSRLVIPQVSIANSGTYSLTASNANGVATSTGQLVVDTKPQLLITEVQSSTAPSPNVPSGDWWELINFEEEPVDITGWRFNDASGDFTDAYKITNRVVLQPGESVIFVEGLTAVEFRAWWGDVVPARTQIIRYSGNGLSLAASGDSIRLWTATTTDVAATVARADFGLADPGVSFNFDPSTKVFGQKSQLGVNGVAKAASSTDVGSPGRITVLIPPRLEIRSSGFDVTIGFLGQAGGRYTLLNLITANGSWTQTGNMLYVAKDGFVQFTHPIEGQSAFFKVLAD